MKLILVLLISLISACSPAEETSREGLDPSGYYSKEEGRHVFHIWRTSKGAWVIETQGIPPLTFPVNSCRTVSVGSMQRGRLVASSDLDVDFSGTLSERDLRYGGTIVEFSESSATLSIIKPGDECALDGNYERREREHPYIRKYRNWVFPESSTSTTAYPD